MNAYLGVDVGGTKTRALIVDGGGGILGWGQAGPGNHEVVGYDGLSRAVQACVNEALRKANLDIDDLRGAGVGLAGYDWPSEKEPSMKALEGLGLSCPLQLVNDTVLGILAGSPDGWGIAVVSGTGCNCWGWNQARDRVGHVTGCGWDMGEGAGASEIVAKALQICAYDWCKRGEPTSLSGRFADYTGAKDLEDMLEGLSTGRINLDASAAPIIFQEAEKGDSAARGLIHWAGMELGELIKAVVRQCAILDEPFTVVMMGSMFDGGQRLITPMVSTVQELAPRAKFTRLQAPPAAGAAILGLESGGVVVTPDLWEHLVHRASALI